LTREEFIAFIEMMFPDNIKREITEAKLRDVSEKMANLCYDSQDIASSAAGTVQQPITPSSAAPTITNGYWAVTIPGTYTNFGNVVLPENNFGFIFKNGSSFTIQSVEMPIQDLTPLENSITSIDTKINDFIQENTVDQYFIPTSSKAQSGLAVNSAIASQLAEVNLNFGGEITDLNQLPDGDGMYLPRVEGVYPNFNNLSYFAAEGFVIFIVKQNNITKTSVPLNQTIENEVNPDNLVFALNGKAVFDFATQKISTVAELRNTIGKKEGQVVELLGYYTSGDKETIKYQWTSTKGIDDGGYVINTTLGSWIALFCNKVSILDFGAKADGLYDNRDVIININNYLNSLILSENLRYSFTVPLSDNYFKTSETLIIPPNINYLSHGVIEYIGSNTAIIIGSKDYLNVKVDLKINIRTPFYNWLNSKNIGFILYNLQSSVNIDIVQVVGFTVGGRLEAVNSNGFVYNFIKLGQLGNNKIDLLLVSNNNGWVNDNLFTGGRFHRTSSVNTNSDKYGVVITSEDGTYVNNNNNNFLKPSFEYNYSGIGETTPIVVEHGVQNLFKDVRIETGEVPYVMKTLNKSTDNILDIGYQGINSNDYYRLIKDLGDYPNTRVISRKNGTVNNRKYLVYNSGYLPKRVFSKDGIHAYAVDELFIGVSTSGSNSKNSPSGIKINNDSVNISASRALGVNISTQKNKRFIINRQLKKDGGKGRVMVRCYDINKNILSNDKLYVKGEANVIPVFSTNYGNCWRMGSDSESNFYIQIHDDVAFIDVLVGGGTNPCDLISFSIDALDYQTSIINQFDKIGYYSTEKPITTSYEIGTFVLNASNNTVIGWRYNGSNWDEL